MRKPLPVPSINESAILPRNKMMRKDLYARARARVLPIASASRGSELLQRDSSSASALPALSEMQKLTLARRQALIINTRGGACTRAAASIHVFFLGAPGRETGWNFASEEGVGDGEKGGWRRRVVGIEQSTCRL